MASKADAQSLAATTDATLTKLSRLLSTTPGLSTTLLTANYTLTLLHAQLTSAATKQLASVATHASEQLKPGTTAIRGGTLPPSRLISTAAGVASLRDKIADVRTFLRLFGLLGVYQLAKATVYKPEADGVLRGVQVTQLVGIALFQVLENIVYLGQIGVLRLQSLTPERRGKLMLWSVRSWALYLAMDFVRLARTMQLRTQREKTLKAAAGLTSDENEKEQKIARQKELDAFYKELAVNVGYAPLAVHWSVIGGLSWVDEFWTGVFGSIVGVAGFRAAWRNLA